MSILPEDIRDLKPEIQKIVLDCIAAVEIINKISLERADDTDIAERLHPVGEYGWQIHHRDVYWGLNWCRQHGYIKGLFGARLITGRGLGLLLPFKRATGAC